MSSAPFATSLPPALHRAGSDYGFDALPLAEVLRLHDELIDRIRLTFGLDRSTFAAEVLPAIESYARYVHLLPASASEYFHQPGGLLALGLEVSFHALQGTDAHIFSGRSSISMRRILEPRWRQATFLAGLCCELHRPLTALVAVDAAGNEWPAYRRALADWLAAQSATRYFVRWRPKATDARGAALFALAQIVAPATLERLDEGRSTIVPHLLASVAGVPVYREHNVLDGLVRQALALVVERDVSAAADWHGLPTSHSLHLERHLVDALRRLATGEPSWRPNEDKSRVWSGRDGVFIAWPQCAADLRSQLERDMVLPGVPKSAEAMLDILLRAGIAQPRTPSEPTWSLDLPHAKSRVAAVKLASPSLLWENGPGEHTQLDQTLAVAVTQAGPSEPALSPPPVHEGGTQPPLLQPDECNEPSASRPSGDREAAQPGRPRFALNAPMRLNPLVRDGLASIIDTMNGPEHACARAVATGVFVPLAELERRGVTPSLAIRALGELSLLAPAAPETPPITYRDFAGQMQPGLLLGPQCVAGVAVATDPPPLAGQESHSAATPAAGGHPSSTRGPPRRHDEA